MAGRMKMETRFRLLPSELFVFCIYSITHCWNSSNNKRKSKTALKNSTNIVDSVKTELTKTGELIGINLSQNINSSDASSWISKNIQNLGSSSLTMFISARIMLFLLYYMLVKREK
jgi:predicted PurR-regulated permease PerM